MKYTPYQYDCLAFRVIDGDTVKVSLDLLTRRSHPEIDGNDLGFTAKPNQSLIEASKALLQGGAIDVGIPMSWSVRLAGIDTPEISTKAGKAVRRVTGLWAVNHPDFKIISLKLDKFAGRTIGILIPAGESDELDEIGLKILEQPEGSLSKMLHNEGLAKPYNGRRKEPWTPAELAEAEAKAIALAKKMQAETPQQRAL